MEKNRWMRRRNRCPEKGQKLEDLRRELRQPQPARKSVVIVVVEWEKNAFYAQQDMTDSS